MNTALLEDIGLTKPQAKAYCALVEHNGAGAPAIATAIGESRSNAYKVLDRLCELGLAHKDSASSKVRYLPTSPAALERHIEKQSAELDLRQRKLKAAMPSLLDFFFTHSEQPSIRYYQGLQGLRDMFLDQTRSKTPVYFIRSKNGIRTFGDDEAHRLRNLFPANNIERYGIIQDIDPPHATPDDRMPVAESDTLMMLHRTWIAEEDYPEPVEWVAYDNKLAIISFGQEVMGIVIESPQIAQAFRRLYTLLDSGLRARPGYQDFPKRALYTRVPMSVRLRQKLSQKLSTPE